MLKNRRVSCETKSKNVKKWVPNPVGNKGAVRLIGNDAVSDGKTPKPGQRQSKRLPGFRRGTGIIQTRLKASSFRSDLKRSDNMIIAYGI